MIQTKATRGARQPGPRACVLQRTHGRFFAQAPHSCSAAVTVTANHCALQAGRHCALPPAARHSGPRTVSQSHTAAAALAAQQCAWSCSCQLTHCCHPLLSCLKRVNLVKSECQESPYCSPGANSWRKMKSPQTRAPVPSHSREGGAAKIEVRPKTFGAPTASHKQQGTQHRWGDGRPAARPAPAQHACGLQAGCCRVAASTKPTRSSRKTTNNQNSSRLCRQSTDSQVHRQRNQLCSELCLPVLAALLTLPTACHQTTS